MTTKEAIKEITSTPKFYLGVMKQSTASRMIGRILKGTASVNSTEVFLSKFGYHKNTDQWLR